MAKDSGISRFPSVWVPLADFIRQTVPPVKAGPALHVCQGGKAQRMPVTIVLAFLPAKVRGECSSIPARPGIRRSAA